MPVEVIPVVVIEVAYLLACAVFGARRGAPAWLSWPHRLMARLAGSSHAPPSIPRPDYAKIQRLECELGLGEDRPIRAEKVCLVKGCSDEEVLELRSWTGMLLVRVHEH